MDKAPQAAETTTCDKVEKLKVGGHSVWQLPAQAAFFYKAGMNIDADGAPKAYHPHSDQGLDKLTYAGESGNWHGIVTDNGKPDGKPIVQGQDDPAPGFFISQTSLEDKTKKRTDPQRYVDATQIPYIALPPEVQKNLNVRLGDLAVVINSKNGQRSEAIFADVGNRQKIGEGSVALADALGISSDPRYGGIDDGVIYMVFPGSGNGKPRSRDEISTEANRSFEAIGGMTQVRACFPELLHLPKGVGDYPLPEGIHDHSGGFKGLGEIIVEKMEKATDAFSTLGEEEQSAPANTDSDMPGGAQKDATT